MGKHAYTVVQSTTNENPKTTYIHHVTRLLKSIVIIILYFHHTYKMAYWLQNQFF
jgi:quinol-cytochrome oxidoreductase complex cytochrome b subunit